MTGERKADRGEAGEGEATADGDRKGDRRIGDGGGKGKAASRTGIVRVRVES